jgi:sulfur carrier protein
MKLMINGNEVESKDSINVSEMLIEQSVKMPEMVSVELNGAILPRTDFDETNLKEGDKIEFLYFMGGGSSLAAI